MLLLWERCRLALADHVLVLGVLPSEQVVDDSGGPEVVVRLTAGRGRREASFCCSSFWPGGVCDCGCLHLIRSLGLLRLGFRLDIELLR